MTKPFQPTGLSLKHLLSAVGVKTDAETTVEGIALNSRLIKPGFIFVALRGANTDGRNFIDEAVAAGASAILVDAADPFTKTLSVPVVDVEQLASKVSAIAGYFYNDPSAKLNLIGVTGTNGKSTCVHLLAQLAEGLGRKAASIGTLGVWSEGQAVIDFAMTTPDAVACQKTLAYLRNNEVSTVAMEVSSHGLSQFRVEALKFRAAIYTNISHEHLDFHGSMDAYAASKSRLFATPGLQLAVINMDDAYAPLIKSVINDGVRVVTYSLLDANADVYASEIQYGEIYTRFKINSPWGEAFVVSSLLGEFNVYNLVAVIATLCAQGASFDHTIALCDQVQAVPGRMQRVSQIQAGITVVVDYAHTPDALEKALAALRHHTRGELWCVFGCGGDRDASKRQPMARVAEAMADRVVVTSDNPRTEDPQAIVTEICKGFAKVTPQVELDRAKAIQLAVTQAGANDVVLLAGKGHENYQIIGTQQLPFSDLECANQALDVRAKQLIAGGAQ